MIRRAWSWVWRRSIRRQLVLGVALVHVVLMTIFVFDLVGRQRAYSLDRSAKRTIAQAQLSAAGAAQEVISNDVAGLTEFVDVLSHESGTRHAMVTDARGHVLADTDPGTIGRYVDDPVSVRLLQGPAIATLLEKGTTTMTAAAPIVVAGRTVGWAWVTRDLSEMRSHLAYVTRAGLFYAFVAMLIGIAFALLLARTVVGQLHLLLVGTTRLAEGRWDEPIPVGAENELGELTQTFNATMEMLLAQRRDLERLNTDLERRVAHRTAELSSANAELASFSYSVSHDLRTPLRSIDGFSRVVLEDYGDKLDEEGTQALHRVRAAAQRMGHLIDDLLSLARVTRAEMHREQVNLTVIARNIVEVLAQSAPDRSVVFVIAEDLAADGDPRLVRILLENLIANAWKFTGPTAEARVELGVEPGSMPPTFFVRDNGAGFNMEYAAKLFGEFQRLHSQQEFEGTGIGLATVKRVVARHGGRVWAEAELGKGATFFFTFGPDVAASPLSPP